MRGLLCGHSDSSDDMEYTDGEGLNSLLRTNSSKLIVSDGGFRCSDSPEDKFSVRADTKQI